LFFYPELHSGLFTVKPFGLVAHGKNYMYIIFTMIKIQGSLQLNPSDFISKPEGHQIQMIPNKIQEKGI